MASYINVDDLKKCFEEFSYYYLHNYEDLAPVVHAHWELYYDETNITYGNYACTNCKTIQGLAKYRYCPYCGAKMDEVINDET